MLPSFLRKILAHLDRENLVREEQLNQELQVNRDAAKREVAIARRKRWLIWEQWKEGKELC